MRSDSIKIVNYMFTAAALITYYVLTGWDNLFSAVFSFLLILSPFVINVGFASFAKTRASQFVLLATAVAYSAWVCFLHFDAYTSTDGQAGFVLLLTAIAASPVLIIAWVACLIIEIKKRKKKPAQ